MPKAGNIMYVGEHKVKVIGDSKHKGMYNVHFENLGHNSTVGESVLTKEPVKPAPRVANTKKNTKLVVPNHSSFVEEIKNQIDKGNIVRVTDLGHNSVADDPITYFLYDTIEYSYSKVAFQAINEDAEILTKTWHSGQSNKHWASPTIIHKSTDNEIAKIAFAKKHDLKKGGKRTYSRTLRKSSRKRQTRRR